MPWWRRKRGGKKREEVEFQPLGNTASSISTGSFGSGFGGAAGADDSLGSAYGFGDAAPDAGSLDSVYGFGDAAQGSGDAVPGGGAAPDAVSLDPRIFGTVRGESGAEWNKLMERVAERLNGETVRNEDAARAIAFEIIGSEWKGKRETQDALRRDMYKKFVWENIRNMLTREPEPASDAESWNGYLPMPDTPPGTPYRYRVLHPAGPDTENVLTGPFDEPIPGQGFALNNRFWGLRETALPDMGQRLSDRPQEGPEEDPGE